MHFQKKVNYFPSKKITQINRPGMISKLEKQMHEMHTNEGKP